MTTGKNVLTPFNTIDLAGQFSALSLGNVLDESTDCVKLISLDGNITYMNRNGLCAMEIDDFCSIRQTAWVDLWPIEARDDVLASLPKAAAGETVRFSAFCPTAKGTPRWWDVSVSRVAGNDGATSGYLSISRDVTVNHLSREALKITAQELKHRLGNTYQMVSSLLVMNAHGNPINEAFAREMGMRLAGIAKAQVLFAESNAPCNLNELIPALVLPFESEAVRIEFEQLPTIFIEQPQADAIALIVGELAVNASKYGALVHGGGISVSALQENDALTICWRERSNRIVNEQPRDGGQGMRLMSKIIEMRGGSFLVNWNDYGLTAKITIKLTP